LVREYRDDLQQIVEHENLNDLLQRTNWFGANSALADTNGHGEATDFVYRFVPEGGVGSGRKLMAAHAEAKAGTRLATPGNNHCPQCNASLMAPNWSEHLSERCVRHMWSCEVCDYEFETAVFFPAFEQAAA
jgi:rubredoxin